MGLKDLYSLGALKTKIQQEFNKFQQAFTQHTTGAVNRHTADNIDMNPVLISETTVQGTIDKMLEGATFLTQDTWYVNATTGNDSADGATSGTALKTLAELGRRTSGRIIQDSVANVTFYLDGDFGSEPLVLRLDRANLNTVVRVIGATNELDTGTITGWQSQVSSTNTRRQLTDSSQDFTSYIGKRIRLTSGANSGLVTWITSLGGGVTVANIGKFNWWQIGADPSIGDSYVIEEIRTKVGGCKIDLGGAWGANANTWQPSVENITFQIISSNSSFNSDVFFIQGTVLRGCLFTNTGSASFYLAGHVNLISCSNDSILIFWQGFFSCYSFVHRNRMLWYRLSTGQYAQSVLHDGNGTADVNLTFLDGAYVRSITDHGFFGAAANASYNSLITLSGLSQWALSGGSSFIWGNSGNVPTNVIKIFNGSGISYNGAAVPVAEGGTAGANVVLAGEAAIPWASLPAIATSPNNAFMNLYQ